MHRKGPTRRGWAGIVVCVVLTGGAVAGCGSEQASAPQPRQDPCPGFGGQATPYNPNGPRFTGAGPHLATLIKSTGEYPKAPNARYVDSEQLAPRLPAAWEPARGPDADDRQNGRHGSAYAAKVQLVVCEYPLSVGGDTHETCGPYTVGGVDAGSSEAIGVDHVRYRYQVREARTAALVGTFDLDSNGLDTPVDLYCPGSVGPSESTGTVVADVVADADLAAALRPYVESVRP